MKLGHRVELLPTLSHLAALTSNPAALLDDPSVTRRKLGMKLLQACVHAYVQHAHAHAYVHARLLSRETKHGSPLATNFAAYLLT